MNDTLQFSVYEDKNSLNKSDSRMLQGGLTDIHSGKLGWWERDSLPERVRFEVTFTLTKRHEGRPDLIAGDVYKNKRLGWIVLQYNAIVDINEELVAGATLRLPSPRYSTASFLTRGLGEGKDVK